MSNLKYILIGLGVGILSLIIIEVIFGVNFLGQVKNDYNDDVESIINLLAESDEAVLQKDYLLAGLTLSEDFQLYLEEGVENGWWTEEFLTQTFLDNIAHVYGSQFKFIFGGIMGTDAGESLKKAMPKIKEFIKSLNPEQLAALKAKLRAIRNKLLSLSPSQISALLNQISTSIPQIKALIDDLKSTFGRLGIMLDSNNAKKVKDLINSYKNGSLGDTIVDKIENSAVVKEITNLINNIEGINVDDIKDSILDAINDSSLMDQIQSIIDKINDTVDDVEGFIDNLLTDADADFDFYTVADSNGDVVLPDGTKISAKLLNALDVEITGVTYSANGTPLNLDDDTLVIEQVGIGFESIGDKVYLATGGTTITGSSCLTLSTLIPVINANI